MKKTLLLLLAVLLLLSCTSAYAYNGADDLKITDFPMTITLFSPFGGVMAPEGDMEIWKIAAEITGVSMQNVANPSISDRGESLNTMLAMGSLPDLIYERKFILQPLIPQGAFLPLKDLIEEYAPNIKAYFENIDDARVFSTYGDGEIYFIAGTIVSSIKKTTGLIPTQCWFVRQDWLDDLGLSVPTTFDEFEAMLYAFRNDDPNHTGEKDTIPFFYRDGSPLGLYQLFGVKGDWAVEAVDPETNTIVYSRATEEYKNALRTIAKWYKDGLIDPELFSYNSQARQQYLGNNTGGCTFDWHESTASMNYNEDILAANPGMKFLPILPPANTQGKIVTEYSARAVNIDDCWGISKDCKDPITLIKYMDFWFSETGCMLNQYGIEGLTYDMVDGKPVMRESALTAEGGWANYKRRLGLTGSVMGLIDIDLSAKTEIAREAFLLYQKDANLVSPMPIFAFTDEEDDIIGTVGSAIWTLAEEYEQQVIYGDKDVDATWAGYMAEMEALGLNEFLDAYNAAYARYCEFIANMN